MHGNNCVNCTGGSGILANFWYVIVVITISVFGAHLTIPCTIATASTAAAHCGLVEVFILVVVSAEFGILIVEGAIVIKLILGSIVGINALAIVSVAVAVTIFVVFVGDQVSDFSVKNSPF